MGTCEHGKERKKANYLTSWATISI